jgi:hypothetical protein
MASVALAQVVFVQGAKGEGAARSEDGVFGHFAFDVKKAIRSNHTFEVGGSLRFVSETPATTPHPSRRVVIEMPRAHVFGKSENVAEFGGPGVLHMRVGERTIERRGRVSVWVQDNRRPIEPNLRPPDVFRIRFFVETNTAPFYGFAGKVHRGDIVVYSRNVSP